MIYILIPLFFIIMLSSITLAYGIQQEDPTAYCGAVMLFIAIGTCAGIIVALTK